MVGNPVEETKAEPLVPMESAQMRIDRVEGAQRGNHVSLTIRTGGLEMAGYIRGADLLRRSGGVGISLGGFS